MTAGIERICGRTFTASTSSPANQLPTAYGSSGTNSICSKWNFLVFPKQINYIVRSLVCTLYKVLTHDMKICFFFSWKTSISHRIPHKWGWSSTLEIDAQLISKFPINRILFNKFMVLDWKMFWDNFESIPGLDDQPY